MDFIRDIISFILHIDEHLKVIMQQYGTLTYAILFLIVFCETGLVVTPFLPGDSLLFAVGALAAPADSPLNIVLCFVILTAAAILGDTVNYSIGKYVGNKLLTMNLPFVKPEYIDRTNAFYAKHGGKAIILARFVPIVRTFAPFVAGIGTMNYAKFVTYNVVGALIWVTLFLGAGYLFGNIPFVQKNFEIVALAIVLVSVLPIFYEWIQSRRHRAVIEPKAEVR